MQFEYASIGLLALVAVETSILLWKSPRKYSSRRFEKPIFVDTSVLMDGRIVSIAKTGFITSELVIPRSVILELQLLADKSDHDKRERARFGLDVVTELQAMDDVKVTIMNDKKALDGVDERLLELARAHGGSVMTIDYNLNKVASVESISVLNINELAQGLRMAHLPGEKFSIELVEKGSDNHQAVGYLSDGTMVVVEHASSKLNQTVTVECIRSLQTVAGKMLFARLYAGGNQATPKEKSSTKPVSSKSTKSPKQSSKRSVPTEISQTKKQYRRKSVSSTERSAPSTTDKSKTSSRPRTSKQREASLLRTIENLSED